MSRDYYQVLGVSCQADEKDIRCAFRRLALKYHPDKNSANASSDSFKRINEAYQALIDPQKRDQYDRERIKKGTISSGWGSLFDSFFGGVSSEKGVDLEKSITISLKEAYFGAQREVEVMRAEECPACGGTGCEPGAISEVCPDCQGVGRIKQVKREVFGSFVSSTTCKVCQGRGRITTSPCTECKGRGWRRKKRKVEVTIPRGIKSGTRIKLVGEGGGVGRRRCGDLYIQVQIEKHPVFERGEDDLVCELSLNFAQVALGDEVLIPMFGDDLDLVIPPGTQSGEVFIVPGKGMPRVDNGNYGDLRVTVRVITPGNLNQQQKDILRELRRSLEEF